MREVVSEELKESNYVIKSMKNEKASFFCNIYLSGGINCKTALNIEIMKFAVTLKTC